MSFWRIPIFPWIFWDIFQLPKLVLWVEQSFNLDDSSRFVTPSPLRNAKPRKIPSKYMPANKFSYRFCITYFMEAPWSLNINIVPLTSSLKLPVKLTPKVRSCSCFQYWRFTSLFNVKLCIEIVIINSSNQPAQERR